MGKLEKATCYLSGPMEYAADGGIVWRREFIRLVSEKNLKIDCIDPTNKPGCTMSRDEDKAYQKMLQESGRWEELRDYVEEYRRSDLRFVDLSDFMVFLIDPSIPQWGTAHEVYEAERQHKPSFFICEGGLYKLPRWLFGVIDLDKGTGGCNVFTTVKEVVEELALYDAGICPMSKEWVLIRKELELLRGPMKRCKSYKRYKGLKKPRCNGGEGCETCWKIYNDKRSNSRSRQQ